MTNAGDWARRVEKAAERWNVEQPEMTVERWRQAMVAKAAQPGGIGSPEWKRRVRKAKRRQAIRHPWRSLGGWLYDRLRGRFGDDD